MVDAINLIVDFKELQTTDIGISDAIGSLAYVCNFKDGVVSEVVKVVNASDIVNYTDDTYIASAFNYLTSVYLVPADYDLATFGLAKTLVIGDGVDEATLVNVNDFDGVVQYTRNFSSLDPEDTTLAKTGNNTVYIHDSVALGIEMISRFLEYYQATGLFINMQLKSVTNHAITIPTSNDVVSCRDNQFSFIYGDVNFETSIYYFRCGGKTIADFYISELLKNTIQVELAKYISINSPAYSNAEFSNMVSLVNNKVIKSFINNGQIVDAKFSIPPVSEQTAENRISGEIKGLDLTRVEASAIWFAQGASRGE